MASSSRRSHIIDYTYQHVNALLSGRREGTTVEQITKILDSRLEKFQKLWEPFAKPSADSKKKIEQGSVTLSDGVTISIEDADKDVVYAISDKFQIDQVDALVLLRSFLYNEGLPPIPDSSDASSLLDELLEAITPFYFSERLHVARCVISLLRAADDTKDPFHRLATRILPQILPDHATFVKSVCTEYQKKTKAALPEQFSKDPRVASHWAKQNTAEQLVLIEVLFWSLWDYVRPGASTIVHMFEVAYDTEFGHLQENTTLMLDDEGSQLQQDIATLWILVTIEVMNLENILDLGLELDAGNPGANRLSSSPDDLLKLHNLIMSHTSPGYVCTILAWAFFLKGMSNAANQFERYPTEYITFFTETRIKKPGQKPEDEFHATMVAASLQPETGLFTFLLSLLAESPVFNAAIALKTSSTVTDPNSIAYRSVLKGLIISLVEYQPVEFIPDFDGLVNVWVALFGNSEPSSVASLCRQFWDFDWRKNNARRAIIDVARTRFPIQFKPLLVLLRAMTGAGLLDGLGIGGLQENAAADADVETCSSYVFHYFKALPTYTQVLTTASRTGPQALYDRVLDRRGAASRAAYTNGKPVKLPGGAILPAKSAGRLLSPDSNSESVIVAWQMQHSGWKVLLEIMTGYILRRQGSLGSHKAAAAARRTDAEATLQLSDIGMESNESDEDTITLILNLILSVVQGNPVQTELLMESLEEGGPVVSYTAKDSAPPDLVQLIIMILEDALSRTHKSRGISPPSLIAPALRVLAALLPLPTYSNRVWLYLRSTSIIFSSERTNSRISVLAMEQAIGEYTMTLSLLQLVQSLLEESLTSLLRTQADQPKMQAIKDEVLLRAVRFVHDEIWVEHSSWKFNRLGDRFSIGRRALAVFSYVLEHMPAFSSSETSVGLMDFMSTTLIDHASTSTIGPMVHTIAMGQSMLLNLHRLRRYAEVRQLVQLLETDLSLVRLVLYRKQSSPGNSKLCLLEQLLCSDVSAGSMAMRSNLARLNPVEVLAGLVKQRTFGALVPLQAVKVLSALCSSLSMCSPAPSSFIGLMSDPQATVAALVRIVQHPYDDLTLRNAIWTFMSLTIDKEPALAGLFVHGRLRIPTIKGKDGVKDEGKVDTPPDSEDHGKGASAFQAACDILSGWKELWEANPQLLASVTQFLDVVFQHGIEHRAILEPVSIQPDFWRPFVSMAQEELGPGPDYTVSGSVEFEDGLHADLHEVVSNHAYRTLIKSHALKVISSDISTQVITNAKKQPVSYTALKGLFENKEMISEGVAETVASSYDPKLQDALVETVKHLFPSLSVDSLRSQEPAQQRTLGDNFIFSTYLLREILRPLVEDGEGKAARTDMHYLFQSVNLNLSLAYAQSALTESWCSLLQQVKSFLRTQANTRGIFLDVAAHVARDIAFEKRSGDMMSAIHAARLNLLVAILEVAWFPASGPEGDIEIFMTLMEQVNGIMGSETFPPAQSFMGSMPARFHQALLQIVFYCSWSCRRLVTASKNLKANFRVAMDKLLTTALLMVMDALRLTVDFASSRLDYELDRDMELLVAVFEQCTRSGLHTPTTWLTRCYETDVIKASLLLFQHINVVGIADIQSLRTRRQPMYSLHILLFHLALAAQTPSAERLAGEGIIAAYSNNSMTPAISSGAIDVIIAEMPGERSPAHRIWCMMLRNVTAVIAALTTPHQFINSQVVGFIQLYAKQISRTLSWTNDEPITLPFLEELELTVQLFHLLANSANTTSRSQDASSPVLRAFTDHVLQLLQQLNYALTHPKHLAGLLEHITSEEKVQIERETSDVTVNTLKELIDSTKRPLLVSVIERLFDMTSNILATLTVLSSAETVLMSDPEVWLLDEALLVPHSKITVNEPASIGTLLELGNCAYDILRFLVHEEKASLPKPVARLDAQGKTSALISSAGPDRKHSIRSARHVLETLLMYITTQLAMWLVKHDSEAGGDVDAEDTMAVESTSPTAYLQKADVDRGQRKKSTLADRLRKGMIGELTNDLQSLLGKAKPVVSMSGEILGGDMVSLMQVLLNFVDERIASSISIN